MHVVWLFVRLKNEKHTLQIADNNEGSATLRALVKKQQEEEVRANWSQKGRK